MAENGRVGFSRLFGLGRDRGLDPRGGGSGREGARGLRNWLFSGNQTEGPRAMDQGSSLLLGIDGLVVDRVLIDDAGRRVVHCSTDPELAGWCPACRQQSSSPKERVTTRPRDVRIGPDRPVLLWHKRKWRCWVPECDRKVFTESLPEDIPARARITTRARRAAAVSIGDHCRPVSGVAAECGMDWNIAHDAFVAYAGRHRLLDPAQALRRSLEPAPARWGQMGLSFSDMRVIADGPGQH